jgi:hypothetical protein
MASVGERVERCPRCSQPTTYADRWLESQCGFCQWPLADDGLSCATCGTLNASNERECNLCSQRL